MGNGISIEELRKQLGLSKQKSPVETVEEMRKNLAEYELDFRKILTRAEASE